MDHQFQVHATTQEYGLPHVPYRRLNSKSILFHAHTAERPSSIWLVCARIVLAQMPYFFAMMCRAGAFVADISSKRVFNLLENPNRIFLILLEFGCCLTEPWWNLERGAEKICGGLILSQASPAPLFDVDVFPVFTAIHAELGFPTLAHQVFLDLLLVVQSGG